MFGVIDPISRTILQKIEEKAGAELKRQGSAATVKRQCSAGIAYRKQCPKCRRLVIRDSLLEKGCFACGWKSEGSKVHGGR